LPDDGIGALIENVAVLLDQTPIFAFSAVPRTAGSESGDFDFMGDPAGDIRPRCRRVRGHEIGDIVEVTT
jgi:hypothetical protein